MWIAGLRKRELCYSSCDPGMRRGLFCLGMVKGLTLRNIITSSGTEMKLVRVTRLKVVRVAYID